MTSRGRSTVAPWSSDMNTAERWIVLEECDKAEAAAA